MKIKVAYCICRSCPTARVCVPVASGFGQFKAPVYFFRTACWVVKRLRKPLTTHFHKFLQLSKNDYLTLTPNSHKIDLCEVGEKAVRK